MTTVRLEEFTARLAAGRLLRVVNFHNTPLGAAASLRAHLEELARDFLLIDFEQFDELFATGVWRAERPPLVAVFYEGYANNATVAAPILDELGLTAWFFIPTVFPDVPLAEQRAFAEAHSIDLVEEELGAERLAITWDEVAAVSERHVVAAHSGTHERIENIRTEEELEREIFRPYQQILSVTGRPPAATAFLGGSSMGNTPVVDDALRAAGYRYVFSNAKVQRLFSLRQQPRIPASRNDQST